MRLRRPITPWKPPPHSSAQLGFVQPFRAKTLRRSPRSVLHHIERRHDLAFVRPKTRVQGFRIIGAHTDSPNLRIKTASPVRKVGYLQLGVEVYGGVLLNSWLDRDLRLAGRVMVRGVEDAHVAALSRFRSLLCRCPSSRFTSTARWSVKRVC